MKILLVDDSKTMRNIQKRTLATLPEAQFVEASDGVEGLVGPVARVTQQLDAEDQTEHGAMPHGPDIFPGKSRVLPGKPLDDHFCIDKSFAGSHHTYAPGGVL